MNSRIVKSDEAQQNIQRQQLPGVDVAVPKMLMHEANLPTQSPLALVLLPNQTHIHTHNSLSPLPRVESVWYAAENGRGEI